MSHTAHRKAAVAVVRCHVVTISDTRTEVDDTGGRAIVEALTTAGHQVVGRTIVPDEPVRIQQVVAGQLADSRVQAVITTGGTGISARDRTYEAVSALIDKRIDGFGELFRVLSYQEVGAAAMLSRALAGTAHGKILISLPGSEHAVRLAMAKLVLPELGHLVREALR